MRVVDLKIEPLSDSWRAVLDDISNSDDDLKDNYSNINFDDFLSFTCVLHLDRIIAFSGLQYDESKWGPHIARCSSRMWIHPDFRFNGMTRFTRGPKFLNSYYCVPKQIEVAKSKRLNTIFVSRDHNRKGFSEYLSLLKTNTGHEFTLETNKYWVCGKVKANSCSQFVGYHHLDSDGNNVWEKYMRLYEIINNSDDTLPL